MELTPEERRRIYEEEKARIEASDASAAFERQRKRMQSEKSAEWGPLANSSGQPDDERSAKLKEWNRHRSRVTAAVVLVAVAIIAVAVIINASSGTMDTTTRRTPQQYETKADFLCGRSFEDAITIADAALKNDTPALMGLVSRGKAFNIGKATAVSEPVDFDAGIAVVLVQSGYNVGEKCYMPKNLVKAK